MMNRTGAIPKVPTRPVSDQQRSIIESAKALSCYHGTLNNLEEDKIFKHYLDVRGAFLLRKSNSQRDILVISIVVDRKNIYHIKLEQRNGRVYIVQGNEAYPSLTGLIEYFSSHPFPAAKHRELYLTKPIPAARPIPPAPLTPPSSRPRSVPKPPFLSAEQKVPSIDERPQMPLPPPQQNPIYAEYRHLYSRVDKVEADQLEIILQLCDEVDKEIENISRMKCSCGLYMEESQLIRGWMMHRDTEGEATRGRIFFLDTQTNTSMWRLPPQLEQELKTSYPEKWKLVNRLTKEPLANYDF